MRDYPIGSFLFWKVDKNRCNEYQFYRFLSSYHQKYNRRNEPINLIGDQGVTAVLDGQQRLTSLYIALTSTFAYKLPRLWWNNLRAFPQRKLHLDIAQPITDDGVGKKYSFQLLTNQDLAHSSPSSFWFPVADILRFEGLNDICRYLQSHGLSESEYSADCLSKLYQVVSLNKLINSYEEEDQDIDKVLDIFIRGNSGGTVLSRSDLLLSIATSQWSEKDVREEIHSLVDELNRIRGGFSFNKDFVLKSCLVLADISSIEFRVRSFTRDNSEKIEATWDQIADSLRTAVHLVARLGYDRHTLRSNNVLIPVAYYLHTQNISEQDIVSNHFAENRRKIRDWVTRALLKRGTFGRGLDTTLRVARSTIQANPSSFPVDKLDEAFAKIRKPFRFDEEELEDLLDRTYGITFTILALLYPGLDLAAQFHIDHIFPRKVFSKSSLKSAGIPEDRIGDYQQLRDRIGNLQILDGQQNLQKSAMMPGEWLRWHFVSEDERDGWLSKNYVDDVPEEMIGFLAFYEDRRRNMKIRLAELLDVKLETPGSMPA